MSIHKYEHKIYFADTDQAAVVHHSNYFRYFEAARIQLLEDIGYPYKDMQANKIGLAPVDISVNYTAPLRLEDRYRIETRCVALKRATLILDQRAYCGETLCCKATVKLASLDESTFKVVPMAEALKDTLGSFFGL